MQNVLSFKKFRKWNSTFNIFPLKYYNQIVQWRSVETCVTHFFGYKIGIFKTEIFELCRVKTVHTDFTCPLSLDFCRNSKSGKVHFGAKFEIEWNPFFQKRFLPDLSLDTIAPNREAALEKIRQLEAPKGNVSDQLSEKSFGLPVFLEHLNDIACNENENIKFKCKIEPKNDSTLQIGNFFHWYHKVPKKSLLI